METTNDRDKSIAAGFLIYHPSITNVPVHDGVKCYAYEDVVNIMGEFADQQNQKPGEALRISKEKIEDLQNRFNACKEDHHKVCLENDLLQNKYDTILLEKQQAEQIIISDQAKIEALEHLLRFPTNYPIHDILGHLVKATDILLIDKGWDGNTYEEMQQCSEIAKQIIIDVNEFILSGKGLDLIYCKLQRLQSALKMNSEQIIGRIRERHKELNNYEFDYKSFYNGWMEGRVDLLFALIEIK